MSDVIERVARAIDNAHLSIMWQDQKCWVVAGSFGAVVAGPFNEERDANEAASTIRARAAIEAMETSGECICPKCGLRHGTTAHSDGVLF